MVESGHLGWRDYGLSRGGALVYANNPLILDSCGYRTSSEKLQIRTCCGLTDQH